MNFKLDYTSAENGKNIYRSIKLSTLKKKIIILRFFFFCKLGQSMTLYSQLGRNLITFLNY